MDTLHHWLLLLMLLHYAKGSNSSCVVKILPDSKTKIPVELGKNFTATCHLQDGSEYTSNDIKWSLSNKDIAEVFYHKINETSVSVTVNISRDMGEVLMCKASRESLTYMGKCAYGIYLDAGYPPMKPRNLTCIALQRKKDISPDLNCYWEPGLRDPLLATNYTLYAQVGQDLYNRTCKQAGSCTVNLSTYPVHMTLKVWVEVKNSLGSERSDEHEYDSLSLVKPNPPNVSCVVESSFTTSFLVEWKHDIEDTTMRFSHAIRYCQVGSSDWKKVPQNYTNVHIKSYRLQSLEPYTEYVVQMRSIGEHYTIWSEWSSNVTVRTPEAKPASPPDLWRIIQCTSGKRKVTLMWKPPVKANGEMLEYFLGIIQDNRPFESHVIKADQLNQMYSLEVPPEENASIEIAAFNSAGMSPKTTLFIPRSNDEFLGVKSMRWWVHDGKLHVEWGPVKQHPPQGIHISEYLLEWVNERDLQPQWQRVPKNVNTTILNGNLAKYKQYNVSVYPIYKFYYHARWHFQAGTPVTKPAYVQQGTPKKGPTVTDTNSKKNSVKLTWEEIPLDLQSGFIQNYTIFYRTGNAEWQSVLVAANIHSYVLTDLVSERDYVVHIMASTEAGSKNGTDFNFKTMKFADGEVELIVVLVCLGFLFLCVFTIMLCLRKREVIKKLLWPQVPDPSDSSIAHWSPDFPVKTDMPKEDVSVVEVDVFDGKSLCEEDKVVLPLKKDKYLSEEHSSGIGGSSCMSSPRHSVSDSDEGDSGQTTASTVQYSSVVASGYKGQTPNHQPPAFARSESTQPLLDCEEHPENHPGERNSYFKRGRELEPQSIDEPVFSAVQEEEASPVVDDAPTLSYMPQQSGYRPQ
ncbi:interleukin-6 receptor subunit beta [Danio aesculapii]|uniref:interleukin-6 receptor subunit beta n=1 Tax=Danio aesculapii TaxID=1142201 RepID=UPI0024C09DFF|nr:interleukin-6 receptor subunit beta [Danio aesculapii]